jgi:hypothetical protein
MMMVILCVSGDHGWHEGELTGVLFVLRSSMGMDGAFTASSASKSSPEVRKEKEKKGR